MAELTIRLRRDPETGKHDIIIDMESDADAMPHEHEQAHREAVEKIIGKNNVGKVTVEREGDAAPAGPEASSELPVRQAQKRGG
ncbi:MAG TPA: hypothetical protein VHR66_28645 [Gemmataceae bacterium]|jgi:hypothetical protein|nr:hypothetical protein [Gemmataceae bacterium]